MIAGTTRPLLDQEANRSGLGIHPVHIDRAAIEDVLPRQPPLFPQPASLGKATFWERALGFVVFTPVLGACLFGGIFLGMRIGRPHDAKGAGAFIGGLVGFLLLYPLIGEVLEKLLFR
jgi:hypothetical protein